MIKFLAVYSREFKGQFKDNEVKKYILDVTTQHLGESSEDVAIELNSFADTGQSLRPHLNPTS